MYFSSFNYSILNSFKFFKFNSGSVSKFVFFLGKLSFFVKKLSFGINYLFYRLRRLPRFSFFRGLYFKSKKFRSKLLKNFRRKFKKMSKYLRNYKKYRFLHRFHKKNRFNLFKHKLAIRRFSTKIFNTRKKRIYDLSKLFYSRFYFFVLYRLKYRDLFFRYKLFDLFFKRFFFIKKKFNFFRLLKNNKIKNNKALKMVFLRKRIFDLLKKFKRRRFNPFFKKKFKKRSKFKWILKKFRKLNSFLFRLKFVPIFFSYMFWFFRYLTQFLLFYFKSAFNFWLSFFVLNSFIGSKFLNLKFFNLYFYDKINFSTVYNHKSYNNLYFSTISKQFFLKSLKYRLNIDYFLNIINFFFFSSVSLPFNVRRNKMLRYFRCFKKFRAFF